MNAAERPASAGLLPSSAIAAGRRLSSATSGLGRDCSGLQLVGDSRVRVGSTLMPGPIVVVDRDRLDVAALGGSWLRADDLLDHGGVVLERARARRSSACRSGGGCLRRDPCGTRACRPSLRTALPTSIVTVPVFGFGIFPRGPRIRPSLPTTPIMSGVAIATSKSSNPSSIFVARSAEPTMSAPASSASLAFSPSANTATRTSLPVPCGSISVPRSCWSAWRTLSPRRKCASTVSSNFAAAEVLQEPDRLERASTPLAVDLVARARGTACRARHQAPPPRPSSAPCRRSPSSPGRRRAR